MTHLLQRLHAADPCPAPVAYDPAVAQGNIDTIVRTDLTVRPVVPALRRRSRAWLAVAAVAVVLGVGGTVVGVEISSDDSTPSAADGPWETFSSNGVSFEHPQAWTSYPPTYSSTMSSGVALLSTAPFPPVCTTTTDSVGTETTECHDPEPDLTGGGVLVDWTSHGFPGWDLTRAQGVDASIDGHPARIDRSDMATECEGTGAVRSVQVVIALPAQSNWVSMTACIGPGDVEADLAAVDRMLASVQFSR